MSEINEWNVYIVEKMINPKGEYELNLNKGDTLELDLKKKWKIEGFDVVLGNPPYQKQVGIKKTQAIWPKFIEKGLNILNKNGKLVYVNPSGWRSGSGDYEKIYNTIIKQNNLIYLNMNDFENGRKTFKMGTNFDWYIVKKSQDYTITLINDIDNKEYKLDLRQWSFIPSGCFDKYKNIVNTDINNKIKIIYDRTEYGTDKKWMKKTKDEEYKYECVYTITQSKGITFYYSNKKGKHFGETKVIWSNGGGTYPIIDMNGKYGMTQFSYAIVDSIENLEKIKKAMESKEFIELMKYVKFTSHKYNYKIIGKFKKDFWKEFET